MRKPLFPRILFILLLYVVVFIALVAIQFTKKYTFTRKIGNFIVSGQYRAPEEGTSELKENEILLDGDVLIYFGGVEFCVGKGSGVFPFSFTGEGLTQQAILPECMIIDEDSINFTFPGGMSLGFIGQSNSGLPEMRIRTVFTEDVSQVELPFKLQKSTSIQYDADGRFIVRSGGLDYSFGNSPMNELRKVLLIEAGGRQVAYRAIPDYVVFTPEDFIIPVAADVIAYNEAIMRWRDENYSLWNRIVLSQNNEDLVVSLITEAFSRGAYRNTISTISPVFLGSSFQTYESSVYLGGMEQSQRLLGASEREKITLITNLINQRSMDFLKEPELFSYLALHKHVALIDSGAILASNIDPDDLFIEIIPGILEGYTAFSKIWPDRQNPFEALMETACQDIVESLKKTADEWVLVFFEEEEDRVFTLRLGKALLAYAEIIEDETWAALGRSLILSACYSSGSINESSSTMALTNAKLFRILNPLEIYPRKLQVSAETGNVWTWTTAQSISSSMQNDILDIQVSFPVGETHYMLIRGIRPFSRIQLYGVDYRTDPQFERYDSSGWSYYAQEETLAIKMRHREAIERIRIIYREPPRPAAPPPAPPPVEEAPPVPAAEPVIEVPIYPQVEYPDYPYNYDW